MSRNGSGSYILPVGNPVVSGAVISSATQNSTLSDIGAALTTSIASDGQTPITANLPMGGFKHTGVAAVTARTDYSRAAETQDSTYQWLTAVSGADTIVASLTTPVLTAYTAGQTFRFLAAATNITAAVTLNINGIGAKSLTRNGATALAVGDIINASVLEVAYDGTQFQLIALGGRAAAGANTDITSLGTVTTTTQAAGDNSTKVATTAFVNSSGRVLQEVIITDAGG